MQRAVVPTYDYGMRTCLIVQQMPPPIERLLIKSTNCGEGTVVKEMVANFLPYLG